MTAKRKSLFAAVMVAMAAVAAWFVANDRQSANDPITASGTVEATEALLGFQTPGRISDIVVREGDRVAAGAELARLDRTEADARREEAAAQAAAARAALRELERGFRSEEVAQGRAALNAATERLNDARRDLERLTRLYEAGAASQESYDKARVAFDLAGSQYEQAVQQMRILETGPRRERIEAQRAHLAQAEAAVRTMDATLANMTIRAPFAGIVTVRHREPGEIVAAGAPIVTIMNPDDRWVRFYVPETRIGAVRIGQPAAITTDSFPERTYRGSVVFIASEAEFTPKTVQTAQERVKLVYAVKVRVSEDPTYDLKPGMPADVRLEQPAP